MPNTVGSAFSLLLVRKATNSPWLSVSEALTCTIIDAAVVPVFVIAGLLCLLIFCASKRVDDLGAYRISSEAGLVITSVNSSLRIPAMDHRCDNRQDDD